MEPRIPNSAVFIFFFFFFFVVFFVFFLFLFFFVVVVFSKPNAVCLFVCLLLFFQNQIYCILSLPLAWLVQKTDTHGRFYFIFFFFFLFCLFVFCFFFSKVCTCYGREISGISWNKVSF